MVSAELDGDDVGTAIDDFLVTNLNTGEKLPMSAVETMHLTTFDHLIAKTGHRWKADNMKHCERVDGQRVENANVAYSESTQNEPAGEGRASSPSLTSRRSMDSSGVCFDDFALIRVIGKGSFGKVTLVKKKDSGRVFAMKILSKRQIMRRNQVEHTKTERRVLGWANHPFIVRLHYAFQTDDKLYFVLDYAPGGELFYHLSRKERFSLEVTRFYAAEIVLALQHLHSLGIVYRDLKPENILLDEFGHVKLADFGLAKERVLSTTGANSLCGTPEYIAPEMLRRQGHGIAVDWWALGMVVYEMLCGLPPWYTDNRQEMFRRIKEAPLSFPSYFPIVARDFVSRLLERDPTRRLGSRGGADEVISHPFFGSIDWDQLIWSEPPLRPCPPGLDSKYSLDTSNFESQFTSLPLGSLENGSSLSSTPQKRELGNSCGATPALFGGFTYEEPGALAAS